MVLCTIARERATTPQLVASSHNGQQTRPAVEGFHASSYILVLQTTLSFCLAVVMSDRIVWHALLLFSLSPT